MSSHAGRNFGIVASNVMKVLLPSCRENNCIVDSSTKGLREGFVAVAYVLISRNEVQTAQPPSGFNQYEKQLSYVRGGLCFVKEEICNHKDRILCASGPKKVKGGTVDCSLLTLTFGLLLFFNSQTATNKPLSTSVVASSSVVSDGNFRQGGRQQRNLVTSPLTR